MLTFAIDNILPTLEATTLFERLAGVIRVAKRQVSDGKDASGKPKFKEQRFPVSCKVTNVECWTETAPLNYKWLTPDDSKRSIGYFEVTRNMSPHSYEGDMIEMRGQVRFVNLMNIKLLNLFNLGATDCDISFYVVATLLKNLDCKQVTVTTNPAITNATVELNFIEQEHDYNFARPYTYSDRVKAMVLYPFSVVSTKWEVIMRINKGCINDLVFGTAIDC